MTTASNSPLSISALKDRAEKALEASSKDLLALSHQIHQNPEIRWQEYESVKTLTQFLASRGFSIEMPLGGLDTAFRARFGSGSRRIAFVAEYDALEGLGHACGHNIIASSAAGAALSLKDLASELDLTIEVLGTPAEEGGGGKILLLDQGIFDGLDAAMMIHPGPADSLWARPFAVSHFDVTYTGFAAHAAAYPHLGTNAADAMTIAQVAIGMLRQQLPPTVRVHGIVREAGTAPNSIPDHCHGSWYVRASSLEELENVYQRVQACFEAGALATGSTLKVEETSPRYSQFENNIALAEAFNTNATILGRDMDAEEIRGGGMNTASTDMGNVSLKIPAIHPYLSIQSLPAVNHQKEFATAAATPAADQTVIDGSLLMAATVIDFLSSQATSK